MHGKYVLVLMFLWTNFLHLSWIRHRNIYFSKILLEYCLLTWFTWSRIYGPGRSLGWWWMFSMASSSSNL